MAQPLPYDGCRESLWKGSDARGASGTTPGCGGRFAAPPGPRARGVGESPGRSAEP
jgi:hypothetical protein